jgi:hypothetical protein
MINYIVKWLFHKIYTFKTFSLELFLPFIAFLFIVLAFLAHKELLAVALVYLEKQRLLHKNSIAVRARG